MADDARISTALPNHPKTKRLRKRHGQAGCWCLVCLFLWVANNRSNGDLSGLSDEEIELAADWMGNDGELVASLVEVRFLDGNTGSYKVHDWHEHNPWAATKEIRIAAARNAANKKWEGVRKALVCEADAKRMRDAEKGNAHHTTPPTHYTTSPNTNGASAFVCPDWIDKEVWMDFEEMRKKIRKPMTDGARRRIVKQLDEWRGDGHVPESILGISIERGWAGVFQPQSFYPKKANGKMDLDELYREDKDVSTDSTPKTQGRVSS